MIGFKEYLTVEGERMLAKMASGTQIRFTRVACGDGTLEVTDLRNQTSLVNEVMSVGIESVKINGGSNIVIKAVIKGTDIPKQFYFREKGIYMSDGETEVLGIYANKGWSLAEPVEPSTNNYIQKTLNTIIALSSETQINIEITNDGYAQAPVKSQYSSMQEFMTSNEAKTLAQGDTAIIDGKLYYFMGNDPKNVNSYIPVIDVSKLVISDKKQLLEQTEAGKIPDAKIVKEVCEDIQGIKEELSFHQTTTTLVDENTIKTEYEDGSIVVTKIDGDVITESYYDPESNLTRKVATTITDTTITEEEIAL